jgi:hypothetical protein
MSSCSPPLDLARFLEVGDEARPVKLLAVLEVVLELAKHGSIATDFQWQLKDTEGMAQEDQTLTWKALRDDITKRWTSYLRKCAESSVAYGDYFYIQGVASWVDGSDRGGHLEIVLGALENFAMLRDGLTSNDINQGKAVLQTASKMNSNQLQLQPTPTPTPTNSNSNSNQLQPAPTPTNSNQLQLQPSWPHPLITDNFEKVSQMKQLPNA